MASFACGASRAHPGGQSGDRPRLWVRLRRPGPCDLPCRFVRLGHRGPGRDLHRRGHGDQLYAGILHLELRRRHAGSGAVVRKLPHLGGPFLRYGGVLRGAGHRREQYRRKSGLAHLVLRRRGRFPYGGPHAGSFAHGGTFSHGGSHRRPLPHDVPFSGTDVQQFRRRMRRRNGKRAAAFVLASRASGGGNAPLGPGKRPQCTNATGHPLGGCPVVRAMGWEYR